MLRLVGEQRKKEYTMEDAALKLVQVLVALLVLVWREGSQVVGFVTEHGHNHEQTPLMLLKAGIESIHRSDFPKDMVFGVSSSAYQVGKYYLFPSITSPLVKFL